MAAAAARRRPAGLLQDNVDALHQQHRAVRRAQLRAPRQEAHHHARPAPRRLHVERLRDAGAASRTPTPTSSRASPCATRSTAGPRSKRRRASTTSRRRRSTSPRRRQPAPVARAGLALRRSAPTSIRTRPCTSRSKASTKICASSSSPASTPAIRSRRTTASAASTAASSSCARSCSTTSSAGSRTRSRARSAKIIPTSRGGCSRSDQTHILTILGSYKLPRGYPGRRALPLRHRQSRTRRSSRPTSTSTRRVRVDLPGDPSRSGSPTSTSSTCASTRRGPSIAGG